jgi:protein-S-isoprenylcysteine O-methyltransferase Ste14
MEKLYLKAAANLLQLPVIVGALVFLPAGTLRYWQAWLFTAVLFACSLAITLYLAIKDPALLERRMKAGPRAEREPRQKWIIAVILLVFAALPVVSACDHRFAWSVVPSSAVILGDLLLVVAFAGFFFVLRENTYSAATVEIAEGQTVISTGPYAVVRHPMYSWALVMTLGIPLALGSLWGLLLFVPALAAVVWRLLEEERFLAARLRGYPEYMTKVPYRLAPFVW